ncbi:MAG: TAXI family TRAP transporter solute-binding subunit [Acetobacterales bacterium]
MSRLSSSCRAELRRRARGGGPHHGQDASFRRRIFSVPGREDRQGCRHNRETKGAERYRPLHQIKGSPAGSGVRRWFLGDRHPILGVALMRVSSLQVMCVRLRGLLSAGLLAGLVAMTGPSAAFADEDVIIVPGAVGGIGFQFVTGMVQSASSDLQKLKARVSITASGGFVDNAVRLHRGIAKVGAITENSLSDIRNRRAQFAAPGKDVVVLFPFYQFIWHVLVREDSAIKTLSDLEGKTISVQPQGAATRIVSEAIFEAIGLKYDGKGLTHQDAADALLSGAVDAICNGGINPVHMAMAATQPVKVVNFTEAEQQKVLAKIDWLTALPEPFDYASYYKGAGKAEALVMWTQMVATMDLSDEVAEALTLSVYKNRDVMIRAHKLAEEMKPEQILSSTMPVHPGAAKAFAALGVTVPEGRIAKR